MQGADVVRASVRHFQGTALKPIAAEFLLKACMLF